MANATATQAYTAVRALEAQMEVTDAEGYHLKVPLVKAAEKIIADNAGVDTFDEAYVGILLAASNITDAADITDDPLAIGIYKGEGGSHEPVPGTDILFLVNAGTYVTSMDDPA